MNAKINFLTILCVIVSTLFFSKRVFSQCYAYPFSVIPLHDELQSQNAILDILQGNGSSPGAPVLIGLGVNQNQPKYMLDILCDPSNSTKNDINISTTAATQNVGYRIGGNYVLWHNGNTSNIFVGVGAGNTTAYNSCTFVGNNAGNANAVINNTALGYDAMMHNTFGARNTAIGLNALYTQSWAHGDTLYLSDNTAIGYGTLYSNQPNNPDGSKNVALGVYALYTNTFGSENMAIGYKG